MMSPRSSTDVASPTDGEDKRQLYVASARSALLELVAQEKAVTWFEVEAKLAEGSWIGWEKAHMPHSLTAAKQELVRARELVEIKPENSDIAVYTLPSLAPKNPAVLRKRALNRRYRSWAESRNLIGPAGEKVVSASLRAAGTLSLINRGGEVPEFQNHKFSGPLDAGGLLPVLDPEDPGHPSVIFCPIEVKNIREWVYPHTERLYQVLDKAAGLQLAQPDLLIHPVLICRRAHYTTFFMAKQLGFKVMELERQYVDPRVSADAGTENHLQEVRNELGMLDLMPVSAEVAAGGDPKLVTWFGKALPKKALDAAQRWRSTVLDEGFFEYFGPLRTAHEPQRGDALEELRRRVKEAGLQGGW